MPSQSSSPSPEKGAGLIHAMMTERLIEAAVAYEGAVSNDVPAARKALFAARGAVEAALAQRDEFLTRLRNLHHAVKIYQFTPDGTPEQAMSARDVDDAMDVARAAIARAEGK